MSQLHNTCSPPRQTTTTGKRSLLDTQRCFSYDDLAVLDLLQHPIWIFDTERRSMWWANTAAVALWNADSLEALLARDYASDMSAATAKRIDSYQEGFRKGECFSEQVGVVS